MCTREHDSLDHLTARKEELEKELEKIGEMIEEQRSEQ